MHPFFETEPMAEQSAHSTDPHSSAAPLAVITGGSKRIGAEITRSLHRAGFNVLLHFHRSHDAATALATTLNAQRANSCRTVAADLAGSDAAKHIFAAALQWHPEGATVLINNASTFYRTPLTSLSNAQWEDLRRSNLDAPLWLSQAFCKQTKSGAIINITDAMVPRGIREFAPYAAAKSGLISLTRSLAVELAPRFRVNAVAPGSILWAEPEPDEAQKTAHLESIPLGRLGTPQDIADAVLFLARAPYLTGQILAVDGGRSLQA